MKLPKALLHPIGTAENLHKRFLQNCISSAIFLSQTSVLLLKRLVNWLIVENIFSKFLQKLRTPSYWEFRTSVSCRRSQIVQRCISRWNWTPLPSSRPWENVTEIHLEHPLAPSCSWSSGTPPCSLYSTGCTGSACSQSLPAPEDTLRQFWTFFKFLCWSTSNLVPDSETATLGDEPLAAANHLVCDLHQERGNPLWRVVEAWHLNQQSVFPFWIWL